MSNKDIPKEHLNAQDQLSLFKYNPTHYNDYKNKISWRASRDLSADKKEKTDSLENP